MLLVPALFWRGGGNDRKVQWQCVRTAPATTAGQEKYSYNFQYYVCPRSAFDSEATVKGTKVTVTAEDLVIIGAYVRPASDFQNLASFVSL